MERIDIEHPLCAVCEDIVLRYHGPLRRKLPRIRDTLSAFAAANPSGSIEALQRLFDELAERIESHMAKEEYLLFPAICAIADGRDAAARMQSAFVTILYPVRMLEAEHAALESTLDQLQALAGEVAATDNQGAWRQCIAELADFQEVLREHHRAEDEVLFPHALDAERRLI